MFVKIVGLAVLVSGIVSASVLDIYQDGAKYRIIPTDRYIGLSKGITAICDGQDVTVMASNECSNGQRLCKELDELKSLEIERDGLVLESKVLDRLLEISKPVEVDADRWIKAASKIAKHKAELQIKEKEASAKYSTKKDEFFRQAPSMKPLYLKNRCAGELEISIPAGYIGVRVEYEADISRDDSMQIRQYLILNNRSGIDITAKELNIYAKPHKIYLRPQQFRPWIVRLAPEQKMLKKSRKNLAYAPKTLSMDTVEAVPVAVDLGAVVQTGYKNYKAAGIELPSTGEDVKVKVSDYKVSAECEFVSYPYMDSRVYKACSFIPKSPIEFNRWHIKKGNTIITDQAYGEYRDGKYLLSVDIDEEVKITREPIVENERSSGIFGGRIKKKDGYRIMITNISDKLKKITVIERIPTSTTDKISVKLLKVTGADSHKLLKDGRVEISLNLDPKEHREIKVLFEISYDKDTKVVY